MPKKILSKPAKTGKPKKRQKSELAIVPAPPPGAASQSDVETAGSEDPELVDNGRFGIVGIGASAGGLEAFGQLLHELPADTGLAYVFVQHLDPKHVSMLNELLQRLSRLPIKDVQNGMRVEPNQVYVIPRNTNMTISNGVLGLSPRPPGHIQNMPIDTFFRSLATDQKGRSIGVILSGNASDGVLGMSAIKAEGGITFAQNVESAKFDSMPRSAIAAGCVDFILPPDQIAKELERLGRHPYVLPVVKDSSLEAIISDGPDGLARIMALIRTQTSVDFTFYKETTVRRRILRRMALKRRETIAAYLDLLRSDTAEVQALYEDILINVTEFFRDPETFEALKEDVFPSLMAHRDNAGPVRIWVPGCSSGEEVYSIAMAMLEFLEGQDPRRSLQMFGTDVSEKSLEKARNGAYPLSEAQNISPERLRRFFTKVNGGYQINKRVRDMCVFAKQNVAKDPPFSKLDLISCRNLLIYLGPVLQRRVIPIFHYALKPWGFLLLGSSETIGSFPELFSMVDKKNKIYSRRASPVHLPLDYAAINPAPDKSLTAKRPDNWSEADILREADRIALTKYGPPGVVIDDDLNILHFRGHTGPYLEPASGAASLNVLKMTREGLSVELRNLINRARTEGGAVRREGLRLRYEGELREFNIEVSPFKRIAGRERLYLISFEPMQHATRAEKKEPGRKGAKSGATALERENAQLRQDLGANKEFLQAIIEEQEASNEELRSANEEIQSSNEELQSTNEELETAKEELQSTNEELNTVNEELQTRNLQLTQTGNDLINLLSNVNIPIVMLGSDFRIRRFTPISERVLNLIPSDVGRPITDIKFNIDIPNLQEMMLDVIENLVPKMEEVHDWHNRRYSLRIRPYRTEDDKIEGVVLVLVDLDPIKSGLDPDLAHVIGSTQPERMSSSIRVFAQRLLGAQEEERRKVSRELHDDLNQKLALLQLDVEGLEKTPPEPQQLSDSLRGLRIQVSELSDDLRRIAYQLHPSVLDDLGLVVALESYCNDFSRREGTKVNFHHNDIPSALGPGIALTVYRVAQEALRNVSKHSGADSAEVTLEATPNELRLTIEDSGIGFDPSAARRQGGLGLTSIEERVRLLGGTVEIRAQPGSGTEISAEIPLQGPDTASAEDNI